MKKITMAFACLSLSALPLAYSHASNEPIRIGVLTDMSGTYSDLTGPGSVAAVSMAVEDYGGKVLNRPVEVISGDHQNKTDTGSAIAREWLDVQNVTMITDLMNSAVALAVARIAREKSGIAIVNGAGTDRLTNEDCTPNTVHYAWDTYAVANSTARSLATDDKNKQWFFITADYAFGKSLEDNTTEFVKEYGGKVTGSIRHPLGTPDFSSYVLQAQSSGAQVVALASGGQDIQNAVKTTAEFGLQSSGAQRIVALAMFSTDVMSIGLDATQGILTTESFYWNMNDQTREWAKQFQKKTGKMPTAMQAANYSSTMHYLQAVDKAGTIEAGAVMQKMRELPINDFYAQNGKIREDGRMVHEMYLVQVKQPSESKNAWDVYDVVATIPGDQAFRPLEKSACTLIKKAS